MRTVLVFGVFDLLHVGHLHFLKEAMKFGSRLIVCIPDDKVVEEDKGSPPIINQEDRQQMLAALRWVNEVSIYSHLCLISELVKYRPDVLVVGGDWGKDQRHKDAEEYVRSYDGIVIRITRYPHESTTAIKRRIQGLLCHDSPEDDYKAFCDGCDDYQKKLFGKSRTEELLQLKKEGGP